MAANPYWNIGANKAIANDGNGWVDGKPSGVDNDQGRVRHAGTVSDTSRWTRGTLLDADPNFGGSIVVSGLSQNAVAAVSGQASALDNNPTVGLDGVTLRVTQNIAGTTHTEFRSGASNSANRSRSIKAQEVIRTVYTKRGLRDGNYNFVTDTWAAGFPQAAESGTWNIGTGATAVAGVDDAANPSQAVPGELTYRDGSANPFDDEYKSRFNN